MALEMQHFPAMKVKLELPVIQACDASECAYNLDSKCHARAVTIGGGSHPACDTFISTERDTGRMHVRNRARTAGVGACKVSGCRHNVDLECEAEGIEVKKHGAHADCNTCTI